MAAKHSLVCKKLRENFESHKCRYCSPDFERLRTSSFWGHLKMEDARCLFYFKASVHDHNADTGKQTIDCTKLLQYFAFFF